jgi:hypothetical protein
MDWVTAELNTMNKEQCKMCNPTSRNTRDLRMTSRPQLSDEEDQSLTGTSGGSRA